MSDEGRREAELDELMARLAAGDRTAFDPLFASLLPRAHRLARARVGSSLAGDVAQATMLKLFARASDFMPGRPLLPWFYAIAANEIRAVRRQQGRLELVEELPTVPSDETPELQYVERELERALELAIASLDEDASEAIGALLGRRPSPNLPSATLRKRISRAYAKLRAILGAHHVR